MPWDPPGNSDGSAVRGPGFEICRSRARLRAALAGHSLDATYFAGPPRPRLDRVAAERPPFSTSRRTSLEPRLKMTPSASAPRSPAPSARRGAGPPERRHSDGDKMASLSSGLEGPDPGSLSAEQLSRLRDFKISTRIANEKYLRSHKEVKLLLSGFFREMFLKRPVDIQEFAAEYFTDPRLPGKIQMQLIELQKQKQLAEP
ncbi:LOW QUALITY PROTEIN: RIIa domain-containing protein 1 [Sarcophilus harrisii]|uniref:LOW QUALITY PROTEIN: RIIa domain-containing protein 1 n=1 Tax=Sarcophilus harrisii TaxID=9305 RepID=UPI001301AC9A|nr:LOW QUALITY PROTEIN: RIIa domain-containing protein 1 [Sarcophilus harrisii]